MASRYIPMISAVGFVIQCMSYFQNKMDKTEQWTWMNKAVARKPE
jgi:hypothetical protein